MTDKTPDIPSYSVIASVLDKLSPSVRTQSLIKLLEAICEELAAALRLMYPVQIQFVEFRADTSKVSSSNHISLVLVIDNAFLHHILFTENGLEITSPFPINSVKVCLSYTDPDTTITKILEAVRPGLDQWFRSRDKTFTTYQSLCSYIQQLT